MREVERTRRQVLAAAGSLAVSSLTGCSSVEDSELDTHASTQFRQGLQNGGYIDETIPNAVETRWAVPTNRGDHSASKGSPVRAPTGDIILADDTGRVRSISTDGEINWATSITDHKRGSHGTPALANDTVYIGAYDGIVSALSLETGEKRWQTIVGDAVGASPTYYDGRLYVAVEHATPSGSIVAIDATSGDIVWRDGWPTDHPHSTVAIDRKHGRLVFGSNDGHCYAWSFPELERRWTYDTGGDVKAPVTIIEGIAVVPSWAGTVTGIDVTDGSRLWEFEADDKIMCAPAIHDGTVYFGSHDRTVYAIDLADGEMIWSTRTDGWITGSAVATNEHVLIGSYDTQLYAIEQDDGSIAWSVGNRGELTSAPLVTDEGIYYTERAVQGDADRPGMCYKLTAVQ